MPKVYAECQKFNDYGSVFFIPGFLSTEIFTVIVEEDVLYTGISNILGKVINLVEFFTKNRQFIDVLQVVTFFPSRLGFRNRLLSYL